MRDMILDLPRGLYGNPAAVPACSRQDFEGQSPRCPTATQIGIVHVDMSLGQATAPLYNISAAPGAAASSASR